jgi:hypothetical protein
MTRWGFGALGLLIAGVSSVRAWRDRTGRREAEEKLSRLDRQYAMISGITALGIRVQDREDLSAQEIYVPRPRPLDAADYSNSRPEVGFEAQTISIASARIAQQVHMKES